MSGRVQKYSAMLKANHGLSPEEKVRSWFELTRSEGYDAHDAILGQILTLESVTYEPTSENPNNARTVFSFNVPRNLCNLGGSLHGGAVALIFDITTSMAITACSKEKFWDTGHVSRNRKSFYIKLDGL